MRVEPPRRQHRGRWAVAVLALIAGAAQADGTWADCQRDGSVSGSQVYQYFEPATIFVPRPTQGRDVFGPWLNAPNAAAWRCTPRTALQQAGSVQLSVQGYPPYQSEGLMDVDGQAHRIYRTNNAQLNYIARWRFTVGGRVSDWTPLTIGSGGLQVPPMSFPITYGDGQPFVVGADVQIRLVRRGSAALPASVTIVDPMYLRHYQTHAGASSSGANTYRIAQLRSGSVSLIAGGTCTTPDVNVVFPTVAASLFRGVGSLVATTPFDLRLNNCPAGYDSIGYSFAPTTRVVNAAQGVVALAASSTARGVGIQLADRAGQPLAFGTVYPLTDYDASMVNSHVVPLQASLYQIAATVSSGSVRSAVTFTLDYR